MKPDSSQERPALRVTAVVDRFRRQSGSGPRLYHGCCGGCCSCCCCYLAVLGPLLAATSTHRTGGRVGLLGHVLLHVLAVGLALAIGGAIYTFMPGGQTEQNFRLAFVGGIPAFFTGIYLGSRFWVSAKATPNQRVARVVAEGVLSLALTAALFQVSLMIWR